MAYKRLTGTEAVFLASLVLLGGCSDPKSIFDTPISPTGPEANGPPIPVPVATIVDIVFDPRALLGGASGRGTAVLTVAAPAGGLPIQLTANDSALTVPAVITIPAGAERLDFSVSSRTVARDTPVSINASVSARVLTRTLNVWAAELPTFFSWFSESGDWVGGGEFGRLTTETAVFSASGSVSGVNIRAIAAGEVWDLSFAPPRGGELRLGRYENAMRSAVRNNISPGLSVSGRGRVCGSLVGRFDVHEAEFSGSQVRRFRAAFQQRCENTSAALIGEVRFTSGAR